MTANEIQKIKNIAGLRVTFPGFISCLLDKSRAMSFAWENATTGHKKVVVHIKWKYKHSHYFLDAGAYDHEQEVLLMNGVGLFIESV